MGDDKLPPSLHTLNSLLLPLESETCQAFVGYQACCHDPSIRSCVVISCQICYGSNRRRIVYSTPTLLRALLLPLIISIGVVSYRLCWPGILILGFLLSRRRDAHLYLDHGRFDRDFRFLSAVSGSSPIFLFSFTILFSLSLLIAFLSVSFLSKKLVLKILAEFQFCFYPCVCASVK